MNGNMYTDFYYAAIESRSTTKVAMYIQLKKEM